MLCRRLYLLIFISLIFVNSLFAISEPLDIIIQKDSYSSMETMLAEVFVNEQPVNALSTADILLSQGNIAPIMVKDTNSHYYFYFTLPDLEDGDYQVKFNVLYDMNNILKILEFSKGFHISNHQKSISINPAAIRIDATKSHDYQIYLKNNKDESFDIDAITDADYASLSKSLILMDPKSQRSFFIIVDKNKISSNQTSSIFLNSNDFNLGIPLLIYNFKEKSTDIQEQPGENHLNSLNNTVDAKSNFTNESIIINIANTTTYRKTNETKKIENPLYFDSENDLIQLDISKNDSFQGYLVLKNDLDYPLNDIKFNLTGNLDKIVRLNITYLEKIGANSSIKQLLYISKLKESNSTLYKGTVLATSFEGYFAVMPIEISIKKEGLLEFGKKTIKQIVSDEEETIYNKNEILDFSIKKTYTNQPDVKKPSRLPLLLFLIIIGIAIFFFYKLMTKKRPRTFDEYVSSLPKKY